MDDFKRKKSRIERIINGSSKRVRKKANSRTRKKRKVKENFKTCKGSSLISKNFPPGKEKNSERLCAKAEQEMENIFFKGLRSDYITRKALNEAHEVKKNEDINGIIDIGKVFLQREGHLGRSLKRFYRNETNEQDQEKSVKISNESFENLERCPLSPISGFTLTFVQDEMNSILKKNKKNKYDVEKEFEIFRHKYEEIVGNDVLLQLPRNGVLEEALMAVRKIQKVRQTDLEKVSREFQREEVHFAEEFKFSAKEFESEKPAGENFIKNFLFGDNLPVSKTDYSDGSFTEKSLEDGLFVLDDELRNYHFPLFQPLFEQDEEDNNVHAFAVQRKNPESPAKDLSLTTPPIQFYRRNMF